MLETELIGKTVNCLLCRGSILYFHEAEKEKFCRHLQFEHSVMYDFDFLLAACKMTDTEKTALVSVFNMKTQETNPPPPTLSSAKTMKEGPKPKQSISKDVKPRPSTSLFKNQIKAKFKQKIGRSGNHKSFGNNIIDVKALKATQFNCKNKKCLMKFKSLPKLVKHKQQAHSERVKVKAGTKDAVKEAVQKQRELVSELLKKKKANQPSKVAASKSPSPAKEIPPQPVKKPASSEPLSSQEGINPASTSLAAEAVKKVTLFPPKTVPVIKIENEDVDEILDVASADKEKFFLGKGSDNGGATQPPETSTQKAFLKNRPKPTQEKESTVREKETVEVPPEPATKVPPEPKTPEPPVPELVAGCSDCVELANSSSKLNRHKRYVHGFKNESPKTHTKKKRESLREAAARETDKAASKETSQTEELNSTPPSDPTSPSDPPLLRSCLKRSSSQPRRLSVSFSDEVSFLDPVIKDAEQSEVSQKKGRGRPRKIVKPSEESPGLKEPIHSSKRSAEEEVDNAISKKPRTEPEEEEEVLRPNPCFETPEIQIDEIISANSLNNKQQALVRDPLSPESTKSPDIVIEDTRTEDVSKSSASVEAGRSGSGVPNLFILRQCENCPDMFGSPEQMAAHSCLTVQDGIQPVLDLPPVQEAQEVLEVKEVQEAQKVLEEQVNTSTPKVRKAKEKNNIVANVLKEDIVAQKPKEINSSINEEAVIIVETEAVSLTETAPNIVAPRFVLDDQPVMVIQNPVDMVKLPYDSFLETVLVEDAGAQNKVVQEDLNLSEAPETIQAGLNISKK